MAARAVAIVLNSLVAMGWEYIGILKFGWRDTTIRSKVDIISLMGSKARKATEALMYRGMLMAKKGTEWDRKASYEGVAWLLWPKELQSVWSRKLIQPVVMENYFHGSFPGGSDGKESACNAGDPGSIPGLGRSPGEGNGNPLHILAWRIPWTEVPGGLQSMGSQRVGHVWATNTHIMENYEPSPIFQTRVSAQSSAHWLKGKTVSFEEDFAVPICKYMQ